MQVDRIPFLKLALASVFIASGLMSASATDAASAVLPLQNLGVDTDARGSVVAALSPQRSTLNVRATRLRPGSVYTMYIDGQRQASRKANSQGVVSLSLANPRFTAPALLSVDPRGRKLVLKDDSGTAVLEATVSGPGEPPGSAVVERATLRPLAARRTAATSRYSRTRDDKSSFDITLPNASGSNWWVYVDGRPEAEIRVRLGVGRVHFSSAPTLATDHLLDFDPRGSIIDISQGTNLVFTGKLRARARNLSFATPSVRPSSIPATAAALGGVALARYRVNADASREFHVELEDVPGGDYQLFVNDTLRAVIAVPAGASGEVEFAANSDDQHKLLLDFDPASTVFSIQRDGTAWFEGLLTTTVPGAAGSNEPVLCEDALTSSGLEPRASGHASFEIRADGRHSFGVEVEDVQPGTYALWVGNVLRGQILAQSQNGRVKGEIEFASPTDDAAKRPLTFDPRGQLVQVRSSAGTLFSHLFGVCADAPDAQAPLHLDFALFATGTSPQGRATAEIKRDDRGRLSFEVEIEDAPVGDFTLSVAGVPKATVSVADTDRGTRGQIEFEDSPGPGELPLDFDVLGQVISLERDGVVWFERTAPAAP